MNDAVKHKPAPLIVKHTMPTWSVYDDEYIEFETPEEAMSKAREIAEANPGHFVDIYQHAVAVRLHPPEANDADAG